METVFIAINRETIRKNPLAGQLKYTPDYRPPVVLPPFTYDYEDPVVYCRSCDRYMNASNMACDSAIPARCPMTKNCVGRFRLEYEKLTDEELNVEFQKRCDSVTWKEPQPHFTLRYRGTRVELLLNGVPLQNVQRIRLDMNAKDALPVLNLWLTPDSIEIDTPTRVADCGSATRNEDSTRTCQCEACQLWWSENVPGYFYCRRCRQTKLEDADGPYSGVCEQCFDDNRNAGDMLPPAATL